MLIVSFRSSVPDYRYVLSVFSIVLHTVHGDDGAAFADLIYLGQHFCVVIFPWVSRFSLVGKYFVGEYEVAGLC